MLCLLIGGCVARERAFVRAAERVQSLYPFGSELTAFNQASSTFIESGISEKKLESVSDETVKLLYSAAGRVAFFFPERKQFIRLQEGIFEEMIRRGTMRPSDAVDLFKNYFGAREFAKAEDLGKRFPEIEFPTGPEEVDTRDSSGSSRWRAFEISDGGEVARLRTLPFEEGVKIVLVMRTGCSVAESAMTEILATPNVSSVFRENGFLLTQRMDSVGVGLWKKHFSFENIFVIYFASDFPGLDFFATPQFYFLKDGKIVSHFNGWGRGKSNNGMEEFRKGLAAVGR